MILEEEEVLERNVGKDNNRSKEDIQAFQRQHPLGLSHGAMLDNNSFADILISFHLEVNYSLIHISFSYLF